jgi:hypothetical protein
MSIDMKNAEVGDFIKLENGTIVVVNQQYVDSLLRYHETKWGKRKSIYCYYGLKIVELIKSRESEK